MSIHHTSTRQQLWVLALAATCTAARAPAADSDFTYPPQLSLEEIQKRVDSAPREHPRLLVKRGELAALRKSLDRDPLRQALADAVVQNANVIIDLPPIQRKKQGRRLLGQSRECIRRTITLSMAYHLTRDAKYAARCEKEMLAVARFPDWNPSHFLDVAEMAFGLAIGYDWLHGQLDDPARKEIRKAIALKAVVLPFETRHNRWVKARNNWGQVCHGGLTAAALAILEHEPALAARTVANALKNVPYSMAAYAPHGSYPEGPGYWSYGTGYNVLLIAVMETALGTSFGLTGAPGFSKTGEYPSLVCGPSGSFFNYADGGAGRRPQPALFWLASRFGRPDWLRGERALLQEAIDQMRQQKKATSRAAQGGRLLPLTLLWLKATRDRPEIRMPLHWQSAGETPITIHRSSWVDSEAVFVGVKAGSPSANHGQMDTGSFVLDADGVRWALDLGAEGYHGIESRGMNLWSRAQDSDRWTIFRQKNHGHNTLVIDDQLQRAKGKGTVVRFSEDPALPHTVVDLSDVYQGQASSVHRGVALLPSREVVIQDELTGLKPGSRVRWGMITPGTPHVREANRVVLQRAGKSLALTNGSPDKTSPWQIIDTAKPANKWDSPNPGTRMVAFEANAPASGKLTLNVVLTPGSCSRSVRQRLKITRLENWGR